MDQLEHHRLGLALIKYPYMHAAKQTVVRFVCTTVLNREETVLFRSYPKITKYNESIVNDAMREGKDEISISLAVKATSAAPTYFPEVVWRPKGVEKHLVFWDGGLLNNNPIDQLWYARYDVVGPEEPEPPISCVISLGTGYTRPSGPPCWCLKLLGIVSSVVALATNTNAKGKDFSRYMTDLNGRPEHKKTKYIRFNPSLEKEKIGLADYTKMDLLIRLTKKFLSDPEEKQYLEDAVCAILPPDRARVKYSQSQKAKEITRRFSYGDISSGNGMALVC